MMKKIESTTPPRLPLFRETNAPDDVPWASFEMALANVLWAGTRITSVAARASDSGTTTAATKTRTLILRIDISFFERGATVAPFTAAVCRAHTVIDLNRAHRISFRAALE